MRFAAELTACSQKRQTLLKGCAQPQKQKRRRILTVSTEVHAPRQSAREPAKHLFLRTARGVRACQSTMYGQGGEETYRGQHEGEQGSAEQGQCGEKARCQWCSCTGPNKHSDVACEKVSGGLQRGTKQHKNTRTSCPTGAKAKPLPARRKTPRRPSSRGPHHLR